MRVNVVDGGRDAFNTMLYNIPDNNTLNWLNNSMSTAREALTGIADHMVNAASDLYNRVNSNAAINAAKSLVANVGRHDNPYMIYGLQDDTVCNANYIMQQYVMANPQVQELYQNNMCYGFEESYYNPEPDVHGEDRYDYQRVMDGVLYEDNEHDEMVINHYSNTDEVEISTGDQHVILDSWAHVENMILNGIDPTDPDGGKL